MIRKLEFVNELREELQSRILPYWTGKMVDLENGGYYGQIDGKNRLIRESPKGSVLNARILWTFSRAFNQFHINEYRIAAARAKEYILNHFVYTTVPGDLGVYWELDYEGTPIQKRNQIYALAFMIYGLSEYYELSRDEGVLNTACQLFYSIEHHSFDKHQNGYFEALDEEWKLLEDVRLSPKDANEHKTMNTHLHILEAYTSLYKVWPEPFLHKQLGNLVSLFFDKIIHPSTHHLSLFFDQDWKVKSTTVSFGHDIESGWLLYEAAQATGDRGLIEKAAMAAVKMADLIIHEAMDEDCGLVNEQHGNGRKDTDKHWWPQAEAMVGMVNAYELTQKEIYLEKAIGVWGFIKNKIIDYKHGEWFFRVDQDGIPYMKEDKAGFWKCPYHNGRACMEIIRRLGMLHSGEMMY